MSRQSRGFFFRFGREKDARHRNIPTVNQLLAVRSDDVEKGVPRLGTNPLRPSSDAGWSEARAWSLEETNVRGVRVILHVAIMKEMKERRTHEVPVSNLGTEGTQSAKKLARGGREARDSRSTNDGNVKELIPVLSPAPDSIRLSISSVQVLWLERTEQKGRTW